MYNHINISLSFSAYNCSKVRKVSLVWRHSAPQFRPHSGDITGWVAEVNQAFALVPERRNKIINK